MKSPFLDKRFKDLTGIRFGTLIITSFSGRDGCGNRLWNYMCDCGNKGVMLAANFTKRPNVSCYECRSKKIGNSKMIHGATRNRGCTREYKSWSGAKYRVSNPKCRRWNDYGGRGITMCARWFLSFERFLEDMGKCPKGMSLDRKDNNGHYEPSNCRWATREQQSQNRRNVKPKP